MGKVAIRDINIRYHSCGENRPPEDAVELDFVKVDRARQLLGTSTLTSIAFAQLPGHPRVGWWRRDTCRDHQAVRAPPLLDRARNARCHSAVAATLLNVNVCNPSTPSASA